MRFSEFHQYLSLALKLVLIVSIISSIYFQLWHIMSTSIFLLLLMFVPQMMKRKYKIKIPTEFEVLLLVFIISTFFLGKISGTIVPIFFGIAIGFIGFLILLILYSSNQIKKNKFMIIFFSLSFAIAFGAILELLKFYLKIILNQEVNGGIYRFAMTNLTYVLVGATISSVIGYIYMKSKKGVLHKAVAKFKKINPKIFSKTDSPEEVLESIEKGEGEKVEFKTTLRVNLHTNEIDRKIEYANLKTIIGFLNSNGGELLIGVTDKGEILGIEKDRFETPDKFNLHFTNLIREKIGKRYLPLISSQLVLIEGKNVFRVQCKPSDKPVFLKTPSGEEEFYIRAGPSSTQLTGSELVEYIERKFKEKN